MTDFIFEVKEAFFVHPQCDKARQNFGHAEHAKHGISGHRLTRRQITHTKRFVIGVVSASCKNNESGYSQTIITKKVVEVRIKQSFMVIFKFHDLAHPSFGSRWRLRMCSERGGMGCMRWSLNQDLPSLSKIGYLLQAMLSTAIGKD